MISGDATGDFDPGDPKNRVLTGVTHAGSQKVCWNGLDNSGNAFPPNSDSKKTYAVHAQLDAGVYHFPLIDAENSKNGGPSFTLTNPPGGECPFTGTNPTTGDANGECSTAFCSLCSSFSQCGPRSRSYTRLSRSKPSVRTLGACPVPARASLVRALKWIDDRFWGVVPQKRVRWMGYDSGIKPGEQACTVAGCTAAHDEAGHSAKVEGDVGYYAPLKENTNRFVKRETH